MKKTLSFILSAFAAVAFAQEGTASTTNQPIVQNQPAAVQPATSTQAASPQPATVPATVSEQTATQSPAQVSTTPAAPLTLADAQKAYVSGKWKEAATAYETVCPQQPAANQTECYLWNILALSQTGATPDFIKAGKRLDSLIQKTDNRDQLYADLIMTRAQFMLYLGKNTRAAENLILAIDNAQDRHKPVLQKVCTAILAKVKNDSLNQRCTELKNPAAETKTVQPAATQPATVQPAANQQAVAPASQPATVQPATQPATTATEATQQAAAPAKPVQESATPVAQPVQESQPIQPAPATPTATASPTPAVAPTPVPAAAVVPPTNPAKETWVLQLGAFGVKSNADLLVSNLQKRGITCKIEERVGETKTLYIVQTAPFASKESAIDFGATKLAPINVEFRAILKK